MNTSKRRYDSPLRRQRAEETRRRVVESAAEVFSRQGYAGTTLAEIATGAEVAVDTVRAAGSKAFLLLEAFRTRYAGEGGWNSLLESGNAQQIFDIEDPDEAVEAIAAFLSAGHARSARLWTTIRSAALVHSEVAEGFADLSRLREESFFYTARWLIRIGVLGAVDGDDELRAVVVDLSSTLAAETYLLLTDDYHLDDAGYRAWVRRTVPRLRP